MTDKPRAPTHVTIRATPDEIAAWQAAADAAQMSRMAWCAAILDAAAGVSELPVHIRRALGEDWV